MKVRNHAESNSVSLAGQQDRDQCKYILFLLLLEVRDQLYDKEME